MLHCFFINLLCGIVNQIGDKGNAFTICEVFLGNGGPHPNLTLVPVIFGILFT